MTRFGLMLNALMPGQPRDSQRITWKSADRARASLGTRGERHARGRQHHENGRSESAESIKHGGAALSRCTGRCEWPRVALDLRQIGIAQTSRTAEIHAHAKFWVSRCCNNRPRSDCPCERFLG